ncbi:MAG: hypothetical protein IPJ71_15440 [Bdellovibrionales bacterium]|nr:hypothetical protein [Bdellovibrionales bacterium]
MKRTILAGAIALLGINAMALENTDLKSIVEGRSEYFCILNRENPKEKNTYDQKVFAGGVFIGTDSDSVIITPKGQVISKNLENLAPNEIMELPGSLVAFMSLTSQNEVKNDLDRNITIGLATFKSVNKAKPDEELLDAHQVMASGYHKGSVTVIDNTRKLNLSCWHKSRLGIN